MNEVLPNVYSIIKGDKYRFTVLSPRLIRLEYNEKGLFEDRLTNRVITRHFEKCYYEINETELLLELKTSYFTLTYVKEKNFKTSSLASSNNLKIKLNNTDFEWNYGVNDVRNIGTVGYSLDDYNCKGGLSSGLYSESGYAIIDDSSSLVLTENGYLPRDNNIIDIYVFMYNKDFGEALIDYYKLTGLPNRVPRYMLGNIWYKNEQYDVNQVSNLVNKFRDNGIIISSIILENWYLPNNRFKFNEKLFSNINFLTEMLNSMGITIGLSILENPYIDKNSELYNELAQSFNNGNNCSFLSMNSNKENIYYNSLIRPLEQNGIKYFLINYNDKNDLNNLWYFDYIHYKHNNVIISRNTKIAPHRMPIIYSGKTKINWETLAKLPEYNSSGANMGISFIANPIGGFYKGVEDDELYIRYIQFGCFSPIMMFASDKGKYYKKEPWKWNELVMGVIKKYMNFRISLIPYIYSESYNYSKYGIPIIKPLYYTYPKIRDQLFYNNEYYFGNSFLVAPITNKKNIIMDRVIHKIFIPEGVWYDFFHGKKYNGDNYYISFYKDEDYPVFCKSGAIIPLSLDNHCNIPTNLEINIFPGSNNIYSLFEDNGNTYSLIDIEYTYEKDNYNISLVSKENNGLSLRRNYRFKLRNMNLANNTIVKVNGNIVNYKHYKYKNDYVIDIFNINIKDNISITVLGSNMEITSEVVINEEIKEVLNDIEIDVLLKEEIDSIIFSDKTISKKRIAIKKLKRKKLERKYIKVFINLLEYIKI